MTLLSGFENAQVVELSATMAMIPMTEELFDEINELKKSAGVSSFEFMTEYTEKKVLAMINEQEIAYVESEFFGGNGGHLGILWKNGVREFETEFHPDSMNAILKRLGVKRALGKDEFLSLQLNRHRETGDWLSP